MKAIKLLDTYVYLAILALGSLLLESNAACSGLCLVKHVDGVAQADPTQSNITEPVSFSTLQEIRRWRFLEPVYQH